MIKSETPVVYQQNDKNEVRKIVDESAINDFFAVFFEIFSLGGLAVESQIEEGLKENKDLTASSLAGCLCLFYSLLGAAAAAAAGFSVSELDRPAPSAPVPTV